MAQVDFEALGKYLNFLYRCNNETSTGIDFSIIDVVFERMGKDHFPTIDELSELSASSKASVSRFVKNFGFNSYSEFKTIMGSGAKSFGLNLQLSGVNRFLDKTDKMIVEDAAIEAIRNIQATQESIDLDGLKQIIHLIKNSKEVVFIGGDRDLECFIKLQIELSTAGIPAYFFLNDDVKVIKSYTFKDTTTVIFVNVASEFFHYDEVIQNAYKKKAKVICINQDSYFKYREYCDLYYQYGEERGLNRGYYSLLYLSNILENLFYKYK